MPVRRTWYPGDSIIISLPMQTRVEYLPDGSPWASILHGPLVLAALLAGGRELKIRSFSQ